MDRVEEQPAYQSPPANRPEYHRPRNGERRFFDERAGRGNERSQAFCAARGGPEAEPDEEVRKSRYEDIASFTSDGP